MRQCSWLWEQNPYQQIEVSSRIYYIKDNNKLKIERSSPHSTTESGVDITVYIPDRSSNLSAIIDAPDDDEWLPHSTDITKSEVAFINISVRFDDDSVQYDISLNTDDMNLYVVGNRIDKYMIWYLVKLQKSIDRYGYSYAIQLMDCDVNVANYSEREIIVIQPRGYYIEKCECPMENDMTASNPKGFR